jgi:hypothetical protein
MYIQDHDGETAGRAARSEDNDVEIFGALRCLLAHLACLQDYRQIEIISSTWKLGRHQKHGARCISWLIAQDRADLHVWNCTAPTRSTSRTPPVRKDLLLDLSTPSRQLPVIVHAAQNKHLTTAYSQFPAAGSHPCARISCSKTWTRTPHV